MNFLYPGFLWALLALAIPVIIHLFFFRRYKKVFFSNVRFLKEIKEETDTRNKLKHLLVLITRMLALAALVLAFAQPFIPNEDSEINYNKRSVSIYVDNSFSMDARGQELSLFESARASAREIAEAHDASDRFQLITNDLEGRHQRLVSRDEFLALLDEVEIGPRTPGLSRVYERQLDALARSAEAGKYIYLISDFQATAVDFEPDTAVQTCLIPLTGVEERNIAIDTAWFDAPVQVAGQQANLRVHVRNFGQEDAERVSVKLQVNGQTKAISEVTVPAGSWVDDTLTFTVEGSGWRQGEIRITDYPVTFDDSWYLSYEVASEVPVLVLSESSDNPFLEKLFGANKLFRLERKRAGGVDYSTLAEYRMIVLDDLTAISSGLSEELQQFMRAGGSVMTFPSAKADLQLYNNFLRDCGASLLGVKITRNREVVSLNTQSQVFRDVFESVPQNLALPTATFSYQLNAGALSREDNIMRFRDGGSFMGRWPVGSGAIYLCASPLNREASDLPVQGGIIVPLLFKTAVLGSAAKSIAYVIGANEWIPLDVRMPNAESQPLVRGKDGKEFLPAMRSLGDQVRIQVDEQVDEAGQYEVLQSEGGLTSTSLSRFSMNFDRKESDLVYLNKKELADRYPDVRIVDGSAQQLAAAVTRINEGQRLWRLCLILALVFLALETLLIRFL